MPFSLSNFARRMPPMNLASSLPVGALLPSGCAVRPAREVTDHAAQKLAQEFHLWPEASGACEVRGAFALRSALCLPSGPSVLRDGSLYADFGAACHLGAAAAVLLEPILNQRRQLRLLASFSEQVFPSVNGEPAPRRVVLAAGDYFNWAPGGGGFHVVLFNKPQIGPPSASVLGKPCPVCRVPFIVATRSVACLCGVVLHCEEDAKDGLQCAQLRRECPACKRPIVLTEGYVSPPNDED